MLLRAENICKRYMRKTGEANFFEPVRSVSFALEPGKLVVLMGRSGSGKTTLLSMLAGLLAPSEGKVYLDDTDLYALDDEALSRLRHDKISVIPQGRSAVGTLSVLENVLLPGYLSGGEASDAEAREWLQKLGISHLAEAMPRELSGGELRRMAIARAMAQGGGVLLADEPTGDLDDASAHVVLAALRDAAKREGKVVFVVTHEREALGYADEAWSMDAGQVTPLAARSPSGGIS